MGGAPFLALGLVSSAVGAAVAGAPWVAIAVGAASIPYLVIGVMRALAGIRARSDRPSAPRREASLLRPRRG
jgi:hypothetical protein